MTLFAKQTIMKYYIVPEIILWVDIDKINFKKLFSYFGVFRDSYPEIIYPSIKTHAERRKQVRFVYLIRV